MTAYWPRPRSLSDGNGLHLRILPSGGRYWRFNYRFNGTQKTKLVGDAGAAMRTLVGDVLAEARDSGLAALATTVGGLASRLIDADYDNRLAASAPFLTMASVMTCGWLMERQINVATARLDEDGAHAAFLAGKIATGNWYLRHVVPEAAGLTASVEAGAAYLYALTAEELAA